jgi:PhnB protein
MSKRESLPRPKGHHVITPGSVVKDAGRVLSFLTDVFGGEVVDRYEGPAGTVLHAEVLVGDSVIMLGEAHAREPMPASLTLYVPDGDSVDATYRRALSAGAKDAGAPTVQPWGYRSACVLDPGGNRWTICAIVELVSHDELVRRMEQGAASA